MTRSRVNEAIQQIGVIGVVTALRDYCRQERDVRLRQGDDLGQMFEVWVEHLEDCEKQLVESARMS